jgi:alkyl sulfatase BDS1-like metallo-beta-lactamase superfamily hydrolase
MASQTRARLYLNQSEISDEIRSGTVRVTQGDVATAPKISALFDKFDTANNITVRPA